MTISSCHGWPVNSDGSDENAFEAFRNERNYLAQGGHFKTTVAAMDWALREIERLRAPLPVSPAPAGEWQRRATKEMIKAAYDCYASVDIVRSDDWMESVINAALSVSPSPPAIKSGETVTQRD